MLIDNCGQLTLQSISGLEPFGLIGHLINKIFIIERFNQFMFRPQSRRSQYLGHYHYKPLASHWARVSFNTFQGNYSTIPRWQVQSFASNFLYCRSAQGRLIGRYTCVPSSLDIIVSRYASILVASNCASEVLTNVQEIIIR